MAREFAKIKAAIWQDDDFRALPPLAQHLYLVLLTDPELSYCGVTDWRPKRIAPKANGWTVEDIETAGKMLADALLVVIDDDTEEVLVRSFLRHDGVMSHNKLCISAANAFSAVASNTIRGVIVHELNRLKNEFPEWPAWGRQQVIEVLKRNSLDPRLAPGLAPSVAPGLGAGLASESGATPAPGLASALQQQQQQQHTTATEESKDSSSRRAPRGHRLDPDWNPSDDDRQYAIDRSVDPDREAENFRDYWLSKPGKDGLKLDWSRTWRTWIRKTAERQPRRPATQGRSKMRDAEAWGF